MMESFWYNWGGVICAVSAFWGSLVLLYFIARERPNVSRELHKRNCHCTICYPNERQNLRTENH